MQDGPCPHSKAPRIRLDGVRIMSSGRVLRRVATCAVLVLVTNRRSHATACSCSSEWATPTTSHYAHHCLSRSATAVGECRTQHSRSTGSLSPRNQLSRANRRKGSLWFTATPALGVRGGAASVRQVSRGQEPAAHVTGLRRSVKVCTLFILSYIFSIGFNVNNKRALLLVPLPWTYAAMNLLVGSGFALASWSLKAAPWPRISLQDIEVLMPMGILHAVSHLTVVLGLGAGAVSFLHTVKAAEACFTAVLSFLLLGQRLPLPVYLTLLPVVVGVGITSCNQIRFSWLALMSALLSNLSNALRNVLIVKYLGPSAGAARNENKIAGFLSPRRAHNTHEQDATSITITSNPLTRTFQSAAALTSTRAGAGSTKTRGLANLAPGDTYRLLTVFGAAVLLPAAACLERESWPGLWQGATDAARTMFAGRGAASPLQQAAAMATAAGGSETGAAVPMAEAATAAAAAVAAAARGDMAEAFRHALLAGVCFNLFYYLTFKLLGQLHPVTHAVGNTIKRIVVIAAGAAAFGGDLGGARGAMGSALAVAGVLGYSVAKARCKPAGVGATQKSR